LSERLLSRLNAAVTDPSSGRPRFGTVKFSWCTFPDQTQLESARFDGDAAFRKSHFLKNVDFSQSVFGGEVDFSEARFTGDCIFTTAQFHGNATFAKTATEGNSLFANVRFGDVANFREATFACAANFRGAQFSDRSIFIRSIIKGRAKFGGAVFRGLANFSGSEYSRGASFATCSFHSQASFESVSFADVNFLRGTFHQDVGFKGARLCKADFSRVSFVGDATFMGAHFEGTSYFADASFGGSAVFRGSRFDGDAFFVRAKFDAAAQLGPLYCRDTLILNGATFKKAVIIELVASRVHARQTHWVSTGLLRIRHADVDLSNAVFSSSMIVSTAAEIFSIGGSEVLDESSFTSASAASVTSLRGVDVGHLLLIDVDLSTCRFGGAMHLDQLRLEGECKFGQTPAGVHFDAVAHHSMEYPSRLARRASMEGCQSTAPWVAQR
jgi:uncharacterized protein YjbI with pentapeptide repeats